MAQRGRLTVQTVEGRLRSTAELLTELEGERVISLNEVGRLNNLSVDTIKRQHSDKIVRTATHRVGMRLKHALALARPLEPAE
jgi:hypothetical protein